MIKQDSNNYRIHEQKNEDLINQSLNELGAGRSILIDNNGVVIAGNGVYEQAEKLGIPIKIIESDGNTLYAVKRTDLMSEDEKRKRLAVLDNKTTDTSEFNYELLKDDFHLETLQELGFEDFEINDIDYSDQNKQFKQSDFDDAMILKLKYTEDQYKKVSSALLKIAATHEEAVLKLIEK